MMMFSVLPAMATHTNPPIGQVVFIANSDKLGIIEHVVGNPQDGFTTDGTKYLYLIPRDLPNPAQAPEVGDYVIFDIVPENSRRATNVVASPDCPPFCGGPL